MRRILIANGATALALLALDATGSDVAAAFYLL